MHPGNTATTRSPSKPPGAASCRGGPGGSLPPWDVELPESPEYKDVRHEYELRRAQATAAGFERVEVLGPLIVEAKVSADPMAGASLALSLQPQRAELVGKQADVVRRLLDGHHSRLAHTDTPEARKKRRQRAETGTLRCFGRGERSQATLRHLNVPASLPLAIEVTGKERWICRSIA
jgi:hypothetical protein